MRVNFFNNITQEKTAKTPVFEAYKSKAVKSIANNLGQKVVEAGEGLSPHTKKILLRENEIFELLAKGLSQQEIAKKLNKHYTEINRIAQKFKAFQTILQERNELILEKLRNGVPRKVLVKEFKLSKRIIDELAQNNNIFKNHVAKRDEEIMKRLRNGELAASIAKDIGISASTVGRIAQKHGYPLQQNLKRLK